MVEISQNPTGVQDLINRLRDDGVKAGRQEAERLVQEAKKQAAQILAQARAEAEAILSQAKSQVENERLGFQEAVKKAVRDTRLELAAQIRTAFTYHVRRLVSVEMEDRNFLRDCLRAFVEAAAADIPKDQPLEILVPQRLFVNGPEGPQLTAEGQERLRHLALGISDEMLREGVVLQPATEVHAGLKVRLVGHHLEIDISDRALTDLLLKYLLPRFQAIVRGVE